MMIASMLETPQVDWLKAHSEGKEIHDWELEIGILKIEEDEGLELLRRLSQAILS